MGRSGPRKPRPENKKRVPAAGVWPITTLALLSIAALFAGSYIRRERTLLKYIAPVLRSETTDQAFPNQPSINLMVIGRDYDYDNNDVPIKSHARSDLLMMAKVDFQRQRVDLVSIPRDTAANIPGHGVTKINAAHDFGGPALTEEVVKSTFGVPTDKYIALDFGGFEQAIDQLGGVDVTVDKKMDYDDNWGHLHIHLLPGYQHLNGEQAMGFVRFRHSDSDLVRTKRQQTVLAAIKAKLCDPGVLARVPDIVATIDQHVDSDMNADQKVALGRFVHDIPRSQITMATLPSDDSSGRLVQTDWTKAAPMLQSVFGIVPSVRTIEADEPHGRHRRRRRPRTVHLAELS